VRHCRWRYYYCFWGVLRASLLSPVRLLVLQSRALFFQEKGGYIFKKGLVLRDEEVEFLVVYGAA
jgi:hypothetical protein